MTEARTEPHPIVDEAISLLRKTSDGERATLRFRPGAGSLLSNRLESLFTAPGDLVRAFDSLSVFAYYLEKEQGSSQAATEILEVLDRAAPRLEALVRDARRTDREAMPSLEPDTSRLGTLLGIERTRARISKTPPPEGSVRGGPGMASLRSSQPSRKSKARRGRAGAKKRK